MIDYVVILSPKLVPKVKDFRVHYFDQILSDVHNEIFFRFMFDSDGDASSPGAHDISNNTFVNPTLEAVANNDFRNNISLLNVNELEQCINNVDMHNIHNIEVLLILLQRKVHVC